MHDERKSLRWVRVNPQVQKEGEISDKWLLSKKVRVITDTDRVLWTYKGRGDYFLLKWIQEATLNEWVMVEIHIYISKEKKKRGKTEQSSRKTLYNQNWNWSNRTKWRDEIAYGLTTSHEIKVSKKRDFSERRPI